VFLTFYDEICIRYTVQVDSIRMFW